MKLEAKFIAVIFLLLIFSKTQAQNVGINPTGATPNASAMLDVSSTNKGVLIPRVALSQTTSTIPVTAPATSLLVYNTATVNDVSPGYYFWDGSQWVRMLDATMTADDFDWEIIGNNVVSGHGGMYPSGNVGIGINNPQFKTDIVGGTTSNTALRLRTSGTGTNQETILRFTNTTVNDATGNYSSYIAGIRTNSPNSGAQALAFGTSTTSSAPTERMRIAADGNVGIAETEPIYRLDVRSTLGVALAGASPDNFIRLDASNASSIAFLDFNTLGRLDFRAQSSSTYSTGGIGSSSTIMTIDGTTNNVGIGTTSPRNKVDVRGDVSINDGGSMGLQSHLTVRQTTNPISGTNILLANLSADFRQNSTSTGYGSGIKFTVGNSDSYTGTAAIVAERTGSWSQGKLHFAVNNSGTSGKTSIPIYMTIDGPSGGHVGIGTTNPTAQLHTTDDVRFENLPSTTTNTKYLTIDDNGNVAWLEQCSAFWEEDFESGNLSQFCATTDFSISTTQVYAGTYSGRITGVQSHYAGADICFSAIQPEYISFRVYHTTNTASHGYFVVQDGTVGDISMQMAMFFYQSGGNLHTVASSTYDLAAAYNTWHRIEFQNIDWINQTFDLYYDGVLQGANIGFRGNATKIDRIFLYNFSSATAYYDNIWIGDMCGTQIPLLALPANTNIQQLESSHPVLKNKAFEAGVAQLNGKSVRVDFSDEFKNQLNGNTPVVVATPLQASNAAVFIEETTASYFILSTEAATAEISFNWIALSSEDNASSSNNLSEQNHKKPIGNMLYNDEGERILD